MDNEKVSVDVFYGGCDDDSPIYIHQNNTGMG